MESTERQHRIDRIIASIEKIPTLPIVSQKILELTADENVSLKSLAGLIEKDQALAIKILKVSNSAFYGFLSKVTSIEHALLILGINEVKAIVLGFSVHNFFSSDQSDTFDRLRFWRHGVVCSQVCRLLERHFHLPSDDSLFLCGLIHDLGKVVVDQYMHDEFLEIVEHVSTYNTTFSEAEKEILGTTHYQIAAKLLQQWQFPRKVVTQVLYHHAPWYDKEHLNATSIVYLADVLTKMAGKSCHADEKQIDVDKFVQTPELTYLTKSGFDLDSQDIKNLVNNIREIVNYEGNNVMQLFG